MQHKAINSCTKHRYKKWAKRLQQPINSQNLPQIRFIIKIVTTICDLKILLLIQNYNAKNRFTATISDQNYSQTDMKMQLKSDNKLISTTQIQTQYLNKCRLKSSHNQQYGSLNAQQFQRCSKILKCDSNSIMRQQNKD